MEKLIVRYGFVTYLHCFTIHLTYANGSPYSCKPVFWLVSCLRSSIKGSMPLTLINIYANKKIVVICRCFEKEFYKRLESIGQERVYCLWKMFFLNKDFGFVIIVSSLSTENCHLMKGVLFSRKPSYDSLETPYFASRKAGSMTQCAAICLLELSMSCIFFMYNEDDSLCKINSTILWKRNVNTTSNWHCYGKYCLFL